MDSPPFDGAAAFARFCERTARDARIMAAARQTWLRRLGTAFDYVDSHGRDDTIDAWAVECWATYVLTGGSLGELYGVAS